MIHTVKAFLIGLPRKTLLMTHYFRTRQNLSMRAVIAEVSGSTFAKRACIWRAIVVA